jgi:uncharacterized membrane protein
MEPQGDRPPMNDKQVELVVGNLLRVGVVLAAIVVAIGGIIYLARYGTTAADHREFHGQPANLCYPVGIVATALAADPRGIIQFGLLLLIATPVARVVFTVFAFYLERDYTYVGVTVVVLLVLLYSLFWGSRL